MQWPEKKKGPRNFDFWLIKEAQNLEKLISWTSKKEGLILMNLIQGGLHE
jgi:hypothetical protein